jgi:hypothetical protein
MTLRFPRDRVVAVTATAPGFMYLVDAWRDHVPVADVRGCGAVCSNVRSGAIKARASTGWNWPTSDFAALSRKRSLGGTNDSNRTVKSPNQCQSLKQTKQKRPHGETPLTRLLTRLHSNPCLTEIHTE